MKINIDNGKVLEDITDEEENIYQKLARATAKAVDINLGKTTLADLLDGYTKYKILEDKINKVTTRIKTIINIIKNQPTDNIHTDMYIIEALNSLLYILEEEKENEINTH